MSIPSFASFPDRPSSKKPVPPSPPRSSERYDESQEAGPSRRRLVKQSEGHKDKHRKRSRSSDDERRRRRHGHREDEEDGVKRSKKRDRSRERERPPEPRSTHSELHRSQSEYFMDTTGDKDILRFGPQTGIRFIPSGRMSKYCRVTVDPPY